MSNDARHPVDLLAEDFAERLRSGEQPRIEDYVEQHPAHAETIRRMFPSIQWVEQLRERQEQEQEAGSGPSAAGPGWLGLTIPDKLGDFWLVRELGRGGMGVVFEAVQQSLNRHVALKVLGASGSGSVRRRERFRREAEAVAGLHHTNIVAVFGIGEDQGLQYYAMHLIDGVTLADVVDAMRHENNLTTALGSDHGDLARRVTADSDARSRVRFSVAEAVERLRGQPSSSQGTKAATGPIEPQSAESQAADVQVDQAQTAAKQADAAAGTIVSESESLDQPTKLTAVTARMDNELPSYQSGDQAGSWAESSNSSRKGLARWDAKIGDQPSPPIVLGSRYIRNVVTLAADVAGAVKYAHGQGVLHRDIKPSNLMLDHEGTVWLTDFGLATQTTNERVTQTGEIVGTLRYMAPEQLQGECDERSDVYALGVTLYELITLRPAVSGAAQLRLDRSRNDRIVSPRSIVRELPTDLDTVIMKSCAIDPAHRYLSAAELEDDLRRILADQPIHARRISSAERLWRWSRRNPAVATLAAVAASLLVAFVVLLGWTNHQKQLDLERIAAEYDRAEDNLNQKTEALETADHARTVAEQERARAETNLSLAMEAIAATIDNVAARGASVLDPLWEELSEETLLVAEADSWLSDADVLLLERLLEFFDRFAAENSQDLRQPLAAARKQVADIQQRLGRLGDAEQSYNKAESLYRELSRGDPANHGLILAQVTILQERLRIAARQGRYVAARDHFSKSLLLLESTASLRDSEAGKYATATTLGLVASMMVPLGTEMSLRLRSSLLSRPNAGRNRARAPGTRARPGAGKTPFAATKKQGAEANHEAIEILTELLEEHPEDPAYRLALARAERLEVRIAFLAQDHSSAQAHRQDAIARCEALLSDYPDTDLYKFELAKTLATQYADDKGDVDELVRARQLADELAVEHTSNAEYQSLRAMIQLRIAAAQLAAGRPERAAETLRSMIAAQQLLADRHPEVLIHQTALVQSLWTLSNLAFRRGRQAESRQTLEEAIARTKKMIRQSGRPQLKNLLERLQERQAKLTN